MTRTVGVAPFRERGPWWGGDLQTVRNVLTRNRGRVRLPDGERHWVALPDGDRLAAMVHRPLRGAAKPLAVIIHGLSGCEDSAYVIATAAYLLAAGHPVMRLNLRGAGPSRAFCADGYHAGRTDDLAALLAGLPPGLTAHGIVAVGYSLGANMLLKYLGERGSEAALQAAVAISAPLDLAAASRRFLEPRNHFYQRWLLRHMKREALASGSRLADPERTAIEGAGSVYAFDDRFVAPRHGFAGADDYYARCSASNFVGDIVIPTLIVHADNDPWIPLGMYRRLEAVNNPALHVEITRGGGHVGFHGSRDLANGRWHDAAIAEFIAVAGNFAEENAALKPVFRCRQAAWRPRRRCAAGLNPA